MDDFYLDRPMPVLLKCKRDQIDAFCRKYGVVKLEAFGSVMTDEFDPGRSDIDFIAYFASDVPPEPWYQRRMEIEAAFAAVIGHVVDVGLPSALTDPFFRHVASLTRTVIVGDAEVRTDAVQFQTRTVSSSIGVRKLITGMRLNNTLEACRAVMGYCDGLGRDDYVASGELQDATWFNIYRMGLWLLDLQLDDPETFQKLTGADELIDLHLQLIRDNDAPDFDRLWDFMSGTLPLLLQETSRLRDRFVDEHEVQLD